MNRNEIQKHFKVGGEKIKGKNDKHLRIAIDKVTKAVRRVKPSNWTYDAKEIFYKKYPDLIYIVEKNKKQKKKKEKEIKQKISPPPKNKKQKKNISTFDLIANLVKNANIANTSEDNNIKSNIKTEVKEEENVSQKKFFRTNLKGNNGIKKKKNLFKKKISKNKNNDKKKIIVREFNHDEFKMTQYIDENNNIWNDKHKLIGRFDETEKNTIMCI
jgi:hypothetical protein